MQNKTINKGSSFGKTIVTIGYLLILLGVFLLFIGISGGDERISPAIYYYVIPFMIFTGVIFSFFKDKIKINFKKQKLFIYSEIFGLKLGNKTNLSNYKNTTVLTKRMKSAMGNKLNNRGYIPQMKLQNIKHEVLLLSTDHRKKVLLGRFNNFKEARDFSREMAAILKKPIVKYTPKRIIKAK